MDDLFEVKYKQILIEWELAGHNIRNHDKLIFAIRGWAISITAAILAVSYSQNKPEYSLHAFLAVVLFWIFDALYKDFQQHFIRRIHKIENYLSSEQFDQDFKNRSKPNLKTPQTAESFSGRSLHERFLSVVKSGLIRNVAFTYAALLLACVLNFYIQK